MQNKEAIDHLGDVLYMLADLHPDDQCSAYTEALAFYNSSQPLIKIEAHEGFSTRLIHETPFCRILKEGETMEKSLHNTDINGTSKNVSDVQVFGDGDAWQLICKASSETEGWMKSTKAMEIFPTGCLVQVTTQQRNPDGSYVIAEAVTFVPGVKIKTSYTKDSEKITERTLVPR